MIAAITTVPARAATSIPGRTLAIDETWTPDGNPYLISGDIIIPPCRKLTIKAGTDVQLLLSDKDHTTIWPGFVAFVVSGQILIEGSPASPVVFEPGPGTSSFMWPWFGIYFRSGATGSRIEYAELNQPEVGLYFEKASPTNAIIRTRISHPASGVQSNDGTLVLDGVVVDGAFTGVEMLRGHLINCVLIGKGDGVGVELEQLQTMRSRLTNVSIHNFAVGLNLYYGSVTMNNSIVTCETPINTNAWVTLNLANDDIYPAADSISCPSCFSADPRYVADRDLHLQPTSPCIDAATTADVPDHDADGTPRPLGAGWDVGAYELAPSGDAGVGGPGLDMTEPDGDGGTMCVVPPDLRAPPPLDMSTPPDLTVADLSVVPVPPRDLAMSPRDLSVTGPGWPMLPYGAPDSGCSCSLAAHSNASPLGPWLVVLVGIVLARVCRQRHLRCLVATVLVGGCGAEEPAGAVDAAMPSLDLSAPTLPTPRDISFAPGLADLSMSQVPDAAPRPLTSAPCLTGGSVVYTEVDNGTPVLGIYTEHPLYWDPVGTGPMPNVFAYQSRDGNRVKIGFSPASGQPLVPGRYDGAVDPQKPEQPWLLFQGPGSGCLTFYSHGWFQIESIAGTINGSHTELTAIFEKQCDQGVGTIRGCIHFEQTFDSADGGL